jgi:hypothetical protein
MRTVRHPARDVDEIERPLSDDLICDVNTATACAVGLGRHAVVLVAVLPLRKS